jgi:hypothetical protein
MITQPTGDIPVRPNGRLGRAPGGGELTTRQLAQHRSGDDVHQRVIGPAQPLAALARPGGDGRPADRVARAGEAGDQPADPRRRGRRSDGTPATPRNRTGAVAAQGHPDLDWRFVAVGERVAAQKAVGETICPQPFLVRFHGALQQEACIEARRDRCAAWGEAIDARVELQRRDSLAQHHQRHHSEPNRRQRATGVGGDDATAGLCELGGLRCPHHLPAMVLGVLLSPRVHMLVERRWGHARLFDLRRRQGVIGAHGYAHPVCPSRGDVRAATNSSPPVSPGPRGLALALISQSVNQAALRTAAAHGCTAHSCTDAHQELMARNKTEALLARTHDKAWPAYRRSVLRVWPIEAQNSVYGRQRQIFSHNQKRTVYGLCSTRAKYSASRRAYATTV